MKIVVCEKSGFCYGVKRALNIAERTRRAKSGPVSTLGDLIHNPRVIADLEGRGIHSVRSPRAVGGGTLIIRSHGISPEIRKQLARKKLDIVDATCPIVKKIQERVEFLAAKNQEVVIVGDKSHPEIQSLIGFSRGKGLIIEKESEVESLPRRKKRAVVSQSTQDPRLFKAVVAGLTENTEELAVYNTICRSVQQRQKDTLNLAARVDTLFIIGGKTSSNSKKLYRMAKHRLSRTFFIESAGEIVPRMLRGANVIGISGGASTPPAAIKEAVTKIRRTFGQLTQREKSVPCQT